MGEKRNVNRSSLGKHDAKNMLGRPPRRWENSDKIRLKETGWQDVDWIHLAQDSCNLPNVFDKETSL